MVIALRATRVLLNVQATGFRGRFMLPRYFSYGVAIVP